MSSGKGTSLYSELSKFFTRPGVTITIDSDYLTTFTQSSPGRFVFLEDENHVIINGQDLSDEDESDILRLIRDVQELGFLVLDAEQEEILAHYQSYNDSNPYKDTLELFTGKIPRNDLNALKMALFMRIKNESGENIVEYRRQIRDRFSSRGLYISNLCNAGYFDNEFRKAALRMDSGTFSDYYELRVGLELAALFIHEGLTKLSAERIIAEKVSSCSKNGIWRFKIHAFGRRNVSLVKEIIAFRERDWGEEVNVNVLSESELHPVYIDVEIELL